MAWRREGEAWEEPSGEEDEVWESSMLEDEVWESSMLEDAAE